MPSNNSYQLALSDPFGGSSSSGKPIQDFLYLSYILKVNDFGVLSATLPIDYFPLIKKDSRLEIWRSVDGGPRYLEGGKPWFVRLIRRRNQKRGPQLLDIVAFDATQLLVRRRVPYAAGSDEADKTDLIDDMMKAIVRENFSSLATDPDRDLLTLLTIQPDLSLAPSTTRAFAKRKVLDILKDLAKESYTKGKYLAFDMVSTSAGSLEFRTYVNQRGVDHSSPNGLKPILLSETTGNLVDAVLTDDYTDEANFIYAGGQGREGARLIATASDPELINDSPWARVEDFIDARATRDMDGVQAEADTGLRDGRPRRLFEGQLVNTPKCVYGRDYGLGDLVTAQYDTRLKTRLITDLINCRVEAVQVTVTGKVDQITTKLRGDS